MTIFEFSWVAGDWVENGDLRLRSEVLILVSLALLSSKLIFCFLGVLIINYQSM